MSTRVKISSKRSKRKVGPFRRLNILHPLAKILLPLGAFCLCFTLLCFSNISIKETVQVFILPPMLKHPQATKRSTVNKKLVALTFDDGPSTTTTPELLKILEEKDVVATFFMVGNKAEGAADIIKNAKNGGNEIASHTLYHQNLNKMNDAQIRSNINDSIKVISSISGIDTKLTRPPYGNFNSKVLENTSTPLVNWSVDTLDWQSRNPSAIMNTTLEQIHDGAIILMHDIYPTTVEAVPNVIDALRRDGYEFVTVSELARERKVKMAIGQVYYNFTP